MKNTYVTQPSLPPLEDFLPYLRQIWDAKIVTNGGPFHEMLEAKLCEYLGVSHISLFSNGTIALITALKALNIRGEVTTTPFSFIATSHSLLWNGLKPVFVDIDPKTLNIDPKKIEAAITEDTEAILAVHCYGNVCDVDEIEKIANKYSLKVIYDAAHAFGVHCHCGSILNHGDLSVLSFHATKVFNTFEGGAIISKNADQKMRIDRLKNFGHNGETVVEDVGINGKMNEFSAALGLAQLAHIDIYIKKRSLINGLYMSGLREVRGVNFIDFDLVSSKNYSYFPILITDDYPITRDELYELFRDKGIFVRRYFYPLISSFVMYKNFHSASADNLPISNSISNQVLCLPIYPDLDSLTVATIIDIVKDPFKR